MRVQLDDAQNQRFAYLCVFNGGEWHPIHWGRIENGAVAFDRMNGGLLYLPAFWVDGAVRPAAAPFFLTGAGEAQPLEASTGFNVAADLPATPDAGYELFVWRAGWSSLGKIAGAADAVTRSDLPAGGLFWLVRDGSRRLERPFAVRDGALHTM